MLVRSFATALVPAESIVYEYGKGLADSAGIQLANSASGAVSIEDGGTVLAQADYGGWFPSSPGASIQLRGGSLSFAAGVDAASWCVSTTAWRSGSEKGTPGAGSACP